MDIHAYQLPHCSADGGPTLLHEESGVRILTVSPAPRALDELCSRLIEAGVTLRTLPVARVIAAIDRVATRLRDDGSAEHAIARAALTTITGYSHAMAVLVLDRICQDWRAPVLEQLVSAELGGVAAMEAFAGHGPARARIVSPRLALHVFSGNVPGVSVTSIVRSLLVQTPVLGKTAVHEPVLAALFAGMLAEEDEVVGQCVAVGYWPGGDEARESAVLEHATLVVHYGGADAIRSLRARVPAHVDFIEHGPRISFALVDAGRWSEAEARDAARQLAGAVAVFDQQGCVSPQLVYVVGGAARARAFAATVAAELDRLAVDLPRGRITAAEAAAIRELRTRAEFAAMAGDDIASWAGDPLAHTVIYAADPAFEGTCLNRTLLVKPASVTTALAAAAPYRAHLQSAGVAGFADAELPALARRLAEIGVSRVAPLAALPWPPMTWHHDGRGPLRELVRWVDLEG